MVNDVFRKLGQVFRGKREVAKGVVQGVLSQEAERGMDEASRSGRFAPRFLTLAEILRFRTDPTEKSGARAIELNFLARQQRLDIKELIEIVVVAGDRIAHCKQYFEEIANSPVRGPSSEQLLKGLAAKALYELSVMERENGPCRH